MMIMIMIIIIIIIITAQINLFGNYSELLSLGARL